MAGCFLIEVYTPNEAAGFPDTVERVRAAAQAMTDEGVPVRYRRALLIRGDDTCLHVLEAPSAQSAIELTTRAGLEFERIVDVIDVAGEEALLESRLVVANDGALDVRGTISIGDGHVLRFPHLRRGSLVCEIDFGEGFSGARGRIASNFLLSNSGELTDNQLGLLFLAQTSNTGDHA